jgi:hypothetical protein
MKRYLLWYFHALSLYTVKYTHFEKSVEKIDFSIVSRRCDVCKLLYDLMFNARGLEVQNFNDIRLNTFFCFYQCIC